MRRSHRLVNDREKAYIPAMTSTHDPADDDDRVPTWVWLTLGGIGGVVLVGAAVLWIVRGSTIVLDLANFLCLT